MTEMDTPQNDPKFVNWRKSSRSGSANGNCVEVAFAADGTVGLRDSKHQAGPVLEFSSQEFAIFLGGVQDGEFDHPSSAR
jgi:hypothetical protein